MCPPSEGGGAPGAVNGTFYDGMGSMPRETAPIANGRSSNERPQQQRGYSSMSTRTSQDRSERQLDSSGEMDPRQRPKKERRPSDKQRICGKCERHLTGQFVRALGGTYHLECFTCYVRIRSILQSESMGLHANGNYRTATR